MTARLAALAVVAVAVAGCGTASSSLPWVPRTPAQTIATTTEARQQPAKARQQPAESHRQTASFPTRAADPSLPRDVAVPVLMYHVINSPPAGTPYPELWVPPDRFADEMKQLATAGYHGVTLTQVDDHWRRGGPLPTKPIVVTFDDGYLSHYRFAAPVLRRLGWPGVLNLEVRKLHETGGLSKRMVRSLVDSGWELAAHTRNHVDLTAVDGATLRDEVAGARGSLRRAFRVPVNFFSYPSGKYDAAAVAAVREAGYLGAMTVDPGLARPDQRYELRRIRVNGSDDPASVVARVRQS